MSNATELLSRALEALDRDCADSWNLDTEIRAFLDAEPEADKPVAWMRTTPNGDQIISFHQVDGFEPLYTRPEPAIRKPMTEEELDALIGKELVDELTARIYKWGFRDAEKHHGIGGDDGQ